MAKLRTRKWLLATLASLTSLLAVGFYALAQAPDEGKRDRKVAVSGGTYHVLPATLETTQWGWLDPAEPPKLVVNSGDTVAVGAGPGSTMNPSGNLSVDPGLVTTTSRNPVVAALDTVALAVNVEGSITSI